MRSFVIGLVGLLLLTACGSVPQTVSGTPASQSIPATATQASTPNWEAATALDPRRLTADPLTYRGANIVLAGEALNVAQHPDYTWVQLEAAVPNHYETQSIVIEFRPRAVDMLQGDCWTIYGIADGTQKVTRSLTGATNEVPLVRGYMYRGSARRNGSCQAPLSSSDYQVVTPTPTPTPLPTRPPDPIIAGPTGEWVTGQSFAVLVHSIVDPFPEDGSGHVGVWAPQAGNRWVSLDVSVENNTDISYQFDPTAFKLLVVGGGPYPMRSAKQEPALARAVISPHAEIRGWIMFEIPADADLVQLRLFEVAINLKP